MDVAVTEYSAERVSDIEAEETDALITVGEAASLTLYLKQYDRISAGGWVWQID